MSESDEVNPIWGSDFEVLLYQVMETERERPIRKEKKENPSRFP